MRKTILIGVHLFLQEKEIKSSHLFVLILSWICGRPRSKLIIFDTNLRLVQILFYQGSCVTAPIRRTDFIPRITCIESACPYHCPLRYQIPLNNMLYNMCIYHIYIKQIRYFRVYAQTFHVAKIFGSVMLRMKPCHFKFAKRLV